MQPIIVRENRVPFFLGVLLLGVGMVFFFLVFWSDLNGNDTVSAGYVLVGICALLGLLMLLDHRLRRLVIDGENCCYRTMFGRKRRFTLQEIGHIKIIVSADLTIRLFDRAGRKLLRLEGNMIGADEALALFDRLGIPVEQKMSSLRAANAEARQEEKEAAQRDLEAAWAECPYFYQSPQWVRRIRILLNLMNIAGIVLAVLAWLRMSMRSAGLVYLLCPLTFYAVYLAFHRIIVFSVPKGTPKGTKKKWLSSHVKFPWTALCLMLLFSLRDAGVINFRNTWSMFLFIPAAAAVAIVPFLLIVRRPRPKGVVLAGVVCAALCYGFISMYYLNWVCRIQPPEHESAVVLQTGVDKGGYRSATSYHLELLRSDGSTEKLEVYPSLLKKVQRLDTVQICKRTSVFGIEYWYVHL